MAAKNVILALLALCSFAYGQTKALFVTTNGTVQWGKTLRFDGPLDFTTNGFAATTRSNLSLGLPALTNTSNAGLLSALGGLATNGDASALTNFPALLLTTNSSESVFPSALLRTNGDGSGLTNLPNANLSNATGVLGLANGGTGQTNAALAIEALLPAYTNNEGKVLGLDTNLALVWTTNVSGGSGSVTSVDASGGSTGLTFSGGPITNTGTLTLGGALGLAYGGTGATNAAAAREAILPDYTNNGGLVLAVATNGLDVEWIAVSNTVTDASTLTNFPTLNQNTTGTASNVTGVVAIANGGSGQTTAASAIEAFLPAYSGNAERVLALNSNATGLVWTTNAGGGGGSGTVTSVAMTVPTFLSVSGSPITTNGTLAVTFSGSALPVSNGGTGGTNAATALTNLLPSYTGNSNRVLALNSDASAVIWTNAGGGLPETPLAISNGGSGASTAAGALTNLGIYVDGSGYTAVVIGPSSVASGTHESAVAIGEQAANTNSANSVAVGFAAKNLAGSKSVAIGRAAVTTNAANAIQLGEGTNSTSTTIQFLSAGTVNTNEWAALANAGAVGTNLLRAANITTAQAAIFTNTTTNAPTNTNAPTPDAWLNVRVGTNDYKLPLWQ